MATFKLHFNAGEIGAGLPLSKMTIPTPIQKSILSERGIDFSGADFPDLDGEAFNPVADASDEHAARYYTEELLKNQDNELLAALTTPESPLLVPDLKLTDTKYSPLTNSNVVSFEQTLKSIPVFGTKAVVELSADTQTLVAFDANLAAPSGVSAVASLSPATALEKLAEFCGVEVKHFDHEEAPLLTFFQEDGGGKWHLAYHFKRMSAPPPAEDHGDLPEEFLGADIDGCCHGSSPRDASPEYDYLVDAHSGEVVFWFGSSPWLDIPVPCTGDDETNVRRTFYGLNSGAGFLLHDPQRNISTYDFGFSVIDPALVPATPISNPAASFLATNRAAVSAHYNATVVFDFFNNVLKRKGIDDKGMLLKSVVNVVESSSNKQWPNAAWWRDHMWYGQVDDGAGGYTSYSKHLDVIGHELAHGVTETTAGLIYAHLSGALNESFSDIFGVLINNWDSTTGFRPLIGWLWEIGPGLGHAGKPIRDFSNPGATGQPDHFSRYRPLPNTSAGDSGGVHYYSGIHNLAVYKVITALDGSGNPVFPPNEVAILYYLTLTKLTARSNFSDSRSTLLNVAGSFYSYDPAVRTSRLQTISDAYTAVGIV